MSWKTIEGFSNYAIKKTGTIINKKTKYIVKHKMTTNGYIHVQLMNNDNIRKNVSVHRLLALTFIPNLNNYSDVNHIDGNRTNNKLENLEWITHKENCSDKVRNARISYKMKRPIVALCGSAIIQFDSKIQAMKYFGADRRHILRYDYLYMSGIFKGYKLRL